MGFDFAWDGGGFANAKQKNGGYFHLYQRLLEAGATPIIAPTTWPWGMRSFFVADPEGNQIEILAKVKALRGSLIK